MSSQASVVVLGIVAALAAIVSYGIWRQRPRAGATWLTFATFGVVIWSVGDAISIGATAESDVFVGAFLALAGAVLSATCWIHFAPSYTGRDEWLSQPVSIAFGAIPASLLLASVLRPTWFVTTTGTGVGSLTFEPGLLYFALAGYGYLLQGTGVTLLLQKLKHSRNIYRRRTFLFVLIGSVMLGGHIGSVIGVSPLPNTMLGPVLFLGIGVLSGLVLYDDRFLKLLPIERLYGLFGDRFGDLAPIARETVIEEMGSGIIVMDANNRIVDLNPTARRMIGGTDRRVIGQKIDAILDPEVFEADQLPFLDADVREGRFDNVWVRTEDGGRRCYDIVLSDLGDRDGNAAGRVGIIHDVTEKQRQKQQLEAQTRKLKRQNENLEAFATIVSHDLRNPLTVATGHVEYALETGETDHLDVALNAHDRISDIISDVLQLARQGRTVDETEPVAIESAATNAWSTIETNGETLEILATPDERIEADASRLQQVFQNLFQNSIEHASATAPSTTESTAATDGGPAESTGSGPGTVTVTVGTTADGFFVEDDGPGIPEDKRESVFVEGYTTDDGGTGLGLAIVSMIVDAHGWDIELTESESGGARFEISTE